MSHIKIFNKITRDYGRIDKRQFKKNGEPIVPFLKIKEHHDADTISLSMLNFDSAVCVYKFNKPVGFLFKPIQNKLKEYKKYMRDKRIPNKTLINYAINKLNENNIIILENVAYQKKNEHYALLILVLFDNHRWLEKFLSHKDVHNIYYRYFDLIFGLCLGYKIVNIKAFYKYHSIKYGGPLTNAEIIKVKKMMKTIFSKKKLLQEYKTHKITSKNYFVGNIPLLK